MDQVKIGKFIASCRKEQGFTQASLADRLGITDRAVSKWETGKSLPDASNMMELCKELKISINELLTGEHIAMEEYVEKAEENFVSLKEKVDRTVKILSRISLIGCIISVPLVPLSMFLNWYYQGAWDKTWVFLISCLVAGITIINAFVCTMLKYEVNK